MKYSVRDAIGEYGITLSDGQKVYDVIHPELRAGHLVELDFAGVDIFASPFFNAAIGNLLEDIRSEDLNQRLKISNLSAVGTDVLRNVLENSKQYYSDNSSRKAVDAILSEWAEAV